MTLYNALLLVGTALTVTAGVLAFVGRRSALAKAAERRSPPPRHAGPSNDERVGELRRQLARATEERDRYRGMVAVLRGEINRLEADLVRQAAAGHLPERLDVRALEQVRELDTVLRASGRRARNGSQRSLDFGLPNTSLIANRR